MNTPLGQLIADKTPIESVLDFLPYPFLISQWRNGTYHNLYFNRRFREEIGYAVDEMATIDDWFAKAYPDEEYRKQVISAWDEKEMEATARGDDSVVMRVIIKTKYAGYQWFEVKSHTTRQFQMVAFVSISETMIREKAQEKLIENKNRTLSILAHDLRAPIANFQSLVALVQQGNITHDEFLYHVAQLQLRTTQLLDVIDTTLLWTKANFDHIRPTPDNLSINDAINEVISFYQSSAEKKGISIEVAVQPYDICSDKGIITIIVRNLLTNAIKFTEKGTIRVEGNHTANGYAIIVHDSGIGIPAQVLRSVRNMDDFSSRPGTQLEKGLGIGLKLCDHLVKKINASLTINSEEGKGTSVRFDLSRM